MRVKPLYISTCAPRKLFSTITVSVWSLTSASLASKSKAENSFPLLKFSAVSDSTDVEWRLDSRQIPCKSRGEVTRTCATSLIHVAR